MGGILSAVSGGSQKENELLWEEQKKVFAENFDFFGWWQIGSAELVLRRYMELGRFKLDRPPSVAANTNKGSSKRSSNRSTTVVTDGAAEDDELLPQDFHRIRTHWSEFMEIILEVDEERQRNRTDRIHWHPAVQGYAMLLDESLSSTKDMEEAKGDDYTDDEPSDDDNDDEEDGAEAEQGGGKQESLGTFSQSSGSIVAAPAGSNYDPTKVCPAFFGYTYITSAELIAHDKIEAREQKELEEQVVSAQAFRNHSQLDELRAEIASKRKAREMKDMKMKEEAEKARKERVKELETAKKVMPPLEFVMLEKQWKVDEATIVKAHRAELKAMREQCAYLNSQDMMRLHTAEDRVREIDKIEVSTNPRGRRLQELSRAEMYRLLKLMDKAGDELEEAQVQLVLGQEQLRGAKGTSAQTIRSTLIVLEGGVTQKEKELEALLADLEGAEILLQRAERISASEERILPLYEALALPLDESDFSACVFDILVALCVTCEDTLWEKLGFLIRVFDLNDNKLMDKDELCVLLETLARVLTSLGMLDLTTDSEEIESAVVRAFLDARIDQKEGMTTYEVKKWLAGKVHQFEMGLLTLMDLKYTIAREQIKYKPHLQSEHKQGLHDRAMAMGDDDPLKPDYSRFLKSKVRSLFSDAVPLKHGHLGNYSEWIAAVKQKTVTKLQNIYRGKLARRAAEKLAKKQAFFAALDIALEETAKKTAESIMKKEKEVGVTKMKWDAKVRMKQAKLRAAGDNRDRPAVLQVMIDEATVAAQEGVRARFNEIGQESGYLDSADVPTSKSDQSADASTASGSKRDREVADSAAGSKKAKTSSKGSSKAALEEDEEDAVLLQLAADTKEGAAKTKEAAQGLTLNALKKDLGKMKDKMLGKEEDLIIGHTVTPRKEESTTTVSLAPSHGIDLCDVSVELSLEGEASMQRRQLMNKGLFPEELYEGGETFSETTLRHKLMSPDPTASELVTRIRDWSSILTKVKTEELLQELPTKRLIMQYVEGWMKRAMPPGNMQGLIDDLRHHFQIVRSAEEIAQILIDLHATDGAHGLINRNLDRLTSQHDSCLVEMVGKEVAAGIQEAEKEYAKRERQAAAQGKPISEIHSQAIKRMQKEKQLRLNTINTARMGISKCTRKLEAAEAELDELTRRERNSIAYQIEQEGGLYVSGIQPEHRMNWIKRYKTALDAPEKTAEDLKAKYEEIINISNDFIGAAKQVAIIIVEEYHLPEDHKTLKPISSHEVDGRGVEGNRGYEGKRLKYEALNIRFKLCLDDHGLFNGSDACAAKSIGGMERRGSLCYMKFQEDGVKIPLVCTVDYNGYRVLAVAKAPIKKHSFTSTGKLRRTKEDHCYGTIDRGEHIINDDKLLNLKLQEVARHLNLAKHMAKGAKELNGKTLWASADLRGFRGEERASFYLLNFWRCMPPEDPSATPHLPKVPRGQSIMWRSLRPEFVKTNPIPLSPDANLLAVHGTADGVKHTENVYDATQRLVKEVIPAFAALLLTRELSDSPCDGYGIDLTAEMHRKGISIRHMGLIRDMYWRELVGTVDMAFGKDRMRTRKDMRLMISPGDTIRVDNEVYEVTKKGYSASAMTLSRKVETRSVNSYPVWKGSVASAPGGEGIEAKGATLRQLMLAEMAARTTKNMYRKYMRILTHKSGSTSKQMQCAVMADAFNIITGSHDSCDFFWEEELSQEMLRLYGSKAVDVGEMSLLRITLQPNIVYIVLRLCDMLGCSFSSSCSSHFFHHPSGFRFTAQDIADFPIRVKHNMPMLSFSEASLLAAKAGIIREANYCSTVQQDMPYFYLTLGERNGSKVAVNLGSGGVGLSGYYMDGIEFERVGPIVNDEANRCILMDPAHKYTLGVTRDNNWRFSITTAEGIEIHLNGCQVEVGVWYHVVGTYDGTVARLYVDSRLESAVELRVAIREKLKEKQAEKDAAVAKIDKFEERAREACKLDTEKEADQYLRTKEGKAAVSKAANKIYHKIENQYMASPEEAEAQGIKRLTKAEAKGQARLAIQTDMYMLNVHKIALQFKQQRDELQDAAARETEELQERAGQSLRIGATCRSKRSKVGRNFWNGELCHTAVFLSCLPSDRVRDHYLAGVKLRGEESNRLYALAQLRYKEALTFAPDDKNILTRYAQSIVDYLELEAAHGGSIRKRVRRVIEAVEELIDLCNWDALSEVLIRLPDDPTYLEVFCRAFNATVQGCPGYFSSSEYLPLDKLAFMPKKFHLTEKLDDPQVISTAAEVFRLVLSDLRFATQYGDINLSWLPKVKSDSAVVTMVSSAQEDEDVRIIDLNKYKLDTSDVDDGDVQVMVDARRLCIILNLTGCQKVSDDLMAHCSKVLKHLSVLTLDKCIHLTDKGLRPLLESNAASISVLGLSQLSLLSPRLLHDIPKICPSLKVVNMSHSPSVGDDALITIAKNCRHLTTLFIQYCTYITDRGLQAFALEVNHPTLTSVDLSGCVRIGDASLSPLAELCTKLTYINLKSMNRVTHVGATAVTHHCWDLTYLCLEDVYNLSDEAFIWDVRTDGRKAVDAHMLANIQELNLRDCNRLTDACINHIAKRCTQLKTLILDGCDAMTELACAYLTEDPITSSPRCTHLTDLSLAYCSLIGDKGISRLAYGLTGLRKLNLAGCIDVTDQGVEVLASHCTQIQVLVLSCCRGITDKSLCSLVDYLWLEELDISHCSRITDDGIEVLAMEFAGLSRLDATRCGRLTDRSLDVLTRYCQHLKELSICDCPFVSDTAIGRCIAANSAIVIKSGESP